MPNQGYTPLEKMRPRYTEGCQKQTTPSKVLPPLEYLHLTICYPQRLGGESQRKTSSCTAARSHGSSQMTAAASATTATQHQQQHLPMPPNTTACQTC